MFEASELRHFVLNLRHEIGLDVDSGCVGKIVGEQRKIGGAPDDPVVLDDRVIIHAVEERRNGANRLDARLGGMFGLSGRLGSRCRAESA